MREGRRFEGDFKELALREMAIRNAEFELWTLELTLKEEKVSKTLAQIKKQFKKASN